MNTVEHLKSEVKKLEDLLTEHQTETQFEMSAAHERLFKLVLNTSTLALTAWVAVIAWNFEPFATQRMQVLISCSLFILSLIAVAIGDFCIIAKCRMGESSVDYFRSGIRDISLKVYFLILQHTEHHQISSQELLSKGTTALSEGTNSLSDNAPKSGNLQKYLLKAITVSSLLGIVIFFIAVWVGVFTMTSYVSQAQSMRDKKETELKATTVLSAPSERDGK